MKVSRNMNVYFTHQTRSTPPVKTEESKHHEVQRVSLRHDLALFRPTVSCSLTLSLLTSTKIAELPAQQSQYWLEYTADTADYQAPRKSHEIRYIKKVIE